VTIVAQMLCEINHAKRHARAAIAEL